MPQPPLYARRAARWRRRAPRLIDVRGRIRPRIGFGASQRTPRMRTLVTKSAPLEGLTGNKTACAADWRDPLANAGTPSRLLRVHQHKENTTRLLAAIDPGVVGRLLHDHVPRLQMHVAVVEHHVDLAGENDRVV